MCCTGEPPSLLKGVQPLLRQPAQLIQRLARSLATVFTVILEGGRQRFRGAPVALFAKGRRCVLPYVTVLIFR